MQQWLMAAHNKSDCTVSAVHYDPDSWSAKSGTVTWLLGDTVIQFMYGNKAPRKTTKQYVKIKVSYPNSLLLAGIHHSNGRNLFFLPNV